MLLLMAQVDDVSGEVMGEFIRRASAVGAKNVQVIPSITKKNRPGYVVYVDTPASLEPEFAELFGAELGTWGYRVIAAEHRHFDIERVDVGVTVQARDFERRFDLRTKRISQPGVFTRIKAEYDDLSQICGTLREAGIPIALADFKADIERELRQRPDSPDITVSLT